MPFTYDPIIPATNDNDVQKAADQLNLAMQQIANNEASIEEIEATLSSMGTSLATLWQQVVLKVQLAQSTGTSTNNAMSQDAVTKALTSYVLVSAIKEILDTSTAAITQVPSLRFFSSTYTNLVLQVEGKERTTVQNFNPFSDNGSGYCDIAVNEIFNNNPNMNGNNCIFYLGSGVDIQFDCTNVDVFVEDNRLFHMIIKNTSGSPRIVDFSSMQSKSDFVFMDSQGVTPAIFSMENGAHAEVSFLRIYDETTSSSQVIIKYFNQLQ